MESKNCLDYLLGDDDLVLNFKAISIVVDVLLQRIVILFHQYLLHLVDISTIVVLQQESLIFYAINYKQLFFHLLSVLLMRIVLTLPLGSQGFTTEHLSLRCRGQLVMYCKIRVLDCKVSSFNTFILTIL